MNKLFVYPAVFYPDDGYVSVYFPDLEGCLTFGDDFNEAYAMAKDALGGWLSVYLKNNPIPVSTPIEKISLTADEKVMLVEVDAIYLKEILNKAIRRNVTIPQWLNMAAEKQGINVSAFLTEKLKEELNIASL
jgi:predicted RNase H-like HicB family nuclease